MGKYVRMITSRTRNKGPFVIGTYEIQVPCTSARFSKSAFDYTRPVRKVSSHFEYLENRWRGLDVTWQPVRSEITVHP